MAAAEKEGNSLNKIPCRSRRAVETIENKICEDVVKTVEKNVDWTESEKSQFKERFQQLFRSSFHECVTVDGQDWMDARTDDEKTTEFEAFNSENLQLLNGELLPELDSLIVQTAKRRRIYPERLTALLKKQYKFEGKTLEAQKASVESRLPSILPETSSDSGTADVLRQSCQDLASLMKSVPSLQLKAENTSKSIEYYRNMGTGSTDDVLFNPIPDETKMADSITPLRQRLDGVKMPRSPKKSQPKYPVRDHNDNHQRRKSLRVRLSKK